MSAALSIVFAFVFAGSAAVLGMLCRPLGRTGSRAAALTALAVVSGFNAFVITLTVWLLTIAMSA